MKNIGAIVLFVTGLLSGLAFSASGFAFDLKSDDILPDSVIQPDYIYNDMGCKGANLSPELHWSHPPKGTKSFALTVFDPTAPTGSGWWHWVAFNIPAQTTSVVKGWTAPAGVTQMSNDFGAAKYDGPCPPPGKRHTYVFTVIALKTEKIDLPAGASNAYARFAIEGSAIGRASFKAYLTR